MTKDTHRRRRRRLRKWLRKLLLALLREDHKVRAGVLGILLVTLEEHLAAKRAGRPTPLCDPPSTHAEEAEELDDDACPCCGALAEDQSRPIGDKLPPAAPTDPKWLPPLHQNAPCTVIWPSTHAEEAAALDQAEREAVAEAEPDPEYSEEGLAPARDALVQVAAAHRLTGTVLGLIDPRPTPDERERALCFIGTAREALAQAAELLTFGEPVEPEQEPMPSRGSVLNGVLQAAAMMVFGPGMTLAPAPGEPDPFAVSGNRQPITPHDHASDCRRTCAYYDAGEVEEAVGP